MKKQSIIEEKEYLERLVAELETRYAEKARYVERMAATTCISQLTFCVCILIDLCES